MTRLMTTSTRLRLRALAILSVRELGQTLHGDRMGFCARWHMRRQGSVRNVASGTDTAVTLLAAYDASLYYIVFYGNFQVDLIVDSIFSRGDF